MLLFLALWKISAEEFSFHPRDGHSFYLPVIIRPGSRPFIPVYHGQSRWGH